MASPTLCNHKPHCGINLLGSGPADTAAQAATGVNAATSRQHPGEVTAKDITSDSGLCCIPFKQAKGLRDCKIS